MASRRAQRTLAALREEFRDRMEVAQARRVWQGFGGRIAAVLSGGGARGAYEAGALLAFQDAGLPTHILTATSVGSINAASYAAHSSTAVGNADSLVESWFDLTPPVVGIEWTRYVWMLVGLIAASAGFGNLIHYLLVSRGYQFNLPNPPLTWISLGLAGTAVLLLYDELPYLGYVVHNSLGGAPWQPDPAKARFSLFANAVVWGLLLTTIYSLGAHRALAVYVRQRPRQALALVGAALLLLALRYRFRAPLSASLHRLLRLPLRSGLFPNFERGRLVRHRTSAGELRASPIRVIFTATDLESGAARYFTNTPVEQLLADRGADPRFIAAEVTTATDLLRAVIASSALPIAYEPMPLEGRLYTDGGIVTNQPIRPAIRLGADVLFLILVDPPGSARGELTTFIDVGLRALNILMLQNLLTDLKLLNSINAACERAAAQHGLRPEEIELDLGTRRYRYVKAFSISPTQPLAGRVLDFGGNATGRAILQGYRDACATLEQFLNYAPQSRFGRPAHVLHFAAEPDRSG